MGSGDNRLLCICLRLAVTTALLHVCLQCVLTCIVGIALKLYSCVSFRLGITSVMSRTLAHYFPSAGVSDEETIPGNLVDDDDLMLAQLTQLDTQTLPGLDAVPSPPKPCAAPSARVTATIVASVEDDPLWQQVADTYSQPLCAKCKYPVDPFRAVHKNKSKARYICKGCNNISTMLTRRLQWPLDQYKDLSASEQVEFWRNCKQTASDDECFQYGKIRGCVISSLTVNKIHQEEAKVTEEFLPLSVWESRGFPAAVIQAKGKTEVNPVLGLCYSCPLKTISRSSIRQQVEAVIRKAEQKLKADGNADFEASDQEEQPVAQGVAQGSSQASDKELDKKRKAEEAALKRASEQIEKKRKADLARENAKHIALATKTLSALTSLVPEVDLCLKHKHKANMPSLVVDELVLYQSQLKNYHVLSSAILDGAKKAAQRDIALDPLPFDGSAVQDTVKKAGNQVKLFNKMANMLG